jgi:cullin 3
MLRDMSASSLVARDYKSVRRGAQADTLEPTVLTTGFWPLQPQPCCQLPPAAQAAADAFTGYYTNKHSARRLQWQAQLGTAVLSVQFNEGVKELLVPSYQMVILLQYGPDRNSFTFDQLTKMTTIPDTELRRHLLSLAHPKSRILIKTPNVAAISASDSFALNLAFSSPSVRVVTPVLSLASVEALRSSAGGAVSGTGTSGGMDSAATQAVMERRKHEIDSAITRILKQRKTMSHTDLVSAVGQALASRFAIDTAFVKKRIEYLISHEYVERDTNDRSVYHYKA